MKARSLSSRLRAAAGLLMLAAAVPAHAGTLQVDPILIEIGDARKTGAITIRNQETKPVTIRAYPLAWTQSDGKDVYTENASVIVSPPIFTIPAGGTQLVRVGLRTPDGKPRAFRLIVEEVPEANPSSGIQVALRLNLPLFAMMDAGKTEDIIWSVRGQPGAGWTLEAINRGSGHVRVDAAMASAATGLGIEPGTSFGVVLPGASRTWAIASETRIADAAKLQTIRQAADGGGRQLSQSSD